MKLLIVDLENIKNQITDKSLQTKTFEIYYDIARLLDIDISREACFRLYTRYSTNYGKLRDYIALLGTNVDKVKFDEEFYRRYKQLYLGMEYDEINEVREMLNTKLEKISKHYITALIAIGNVKFTQNLLKFMDINKYFNSVRSSEYFDDYYVFLSSIIKDNVIESNPPDDFIIMNKNEEVRKHIMEDETLLKFNIKFKDFSDLIL